MNGLGLDIHEIKVKGEDMNVFRKKFFVIGWFCCSCGFLTACANAQTENGSLPVTEIAEETEVQKELTEKENNSADTKALTNDSETESESVPKLAEGETFWFGNYHGEPIEWAVIGSTDDKALLWTKYCVDAHQFHNDGLAEVSWDICTLRQWLNTEFMQDAFNEEERSHIANTTLDNIECGQTEDRLFILSAKDLEDYPGTYQYRIGYPTVYAENNGLFVSAGMFSAESAGKCNYWIRGNHEEQRDIFADWIDVHGEIRYRMEINDGSIGVRAALWYNFEAEDSGSVAAGGSEYILEGSSERYFTAEELSGLSKEQLRLARNEIYARHGYRFGSEDLMQYFSEKSWYYPNDLSMEAIGASMNIYEKQNIQLIVSLEDGASAPGNGENTQYGYPELDEDTLSLFEGDMEMTHFPSLIGEWVCGDQEETIVITEDKFNGHPYRVLKLEYVDRLCSYQAALAVYFEDDIRIVQLTTERNVTRAWQDVFKMKWFDRYGNPETKNGYEVENDYDYHKNG